MIPRDDDSQERVLRAYTVLRLLRQDWGGALIAGCGLGPQGAALAMAANVAGAVCLSIEEQPETLKAALRSGSCDFIVNTLDEALRAIKNEVRKRLPISVGLQGSPVAVLRELLERGVQPELFTDLAPSLHQPLDCIAAHRDAIQQLRRQGAMLVDFDLGLPVDGAIDARARLGCYVQERQWDLQSFTMASAASLRQFDASALSLVGEDDTLRRQWLRSATRIVQREHPLRRALWVTAAEKQALQAEFSLTV